MNKPMKYEIPVYKLQLVQEGTIAMRQVLGPESLYELLEDVATADREMMVVVFLNTKNMPIGRQTISIGTLNASLVHPREVMKCACLANACSILVGHNHPSGDVTPSYEDDQVTKRIARAASILDIPLLDHVVITPDGKFYSYRNERPELLKGGE